MIVEILTNKGLVDYDYKGGPYTKKACLMETTVDTATPYTPTDADLKTREHLATAAWHQMKPDGRIGDLWAGRVIESGVVQYVNYVKGIFATFKE